MANEQQKWLRVDRRLRDDSGPTQVRFANLGRPGPSEAQPVSAEALCGYELFHEWLSGSATAKDVRKSCAGEAGWTKYYFSMLAGAENGESEVPPKLKAAVALASLMHAVPAPAPAPAADEAETESEGGWSDASWPVPGDALGAVPCVNWVGDDGAAWGSDDESITDEILVEVPDWDWPDADADASDCDGTVCSMELE